MGIGLVTLGAVSLSASSVASSISTDHFSTAATRYIGGYLEAGTKELKKDEDYSALGVKLGVGGMIAGFLDVGSMTAAATGKKRRKAS